jgi:hypothetical protein
VFAQKLDLEPVFGREPLGVVSDLFADRIQVLSQVEAPNTGPTQHSGHGIGMRDRHQCT